MKPYELGLGNMVIFQKDSHLIIREKQFYTELSKFYNVFDTNNLLDIHKCLKKKS